MSNKNTTSWCPITRLTEVIGDRWSLLILRELLLCPQRFKELKEHIHGISMDQLTRKLEQLCDQGFIVRQEFSESPPRVVYQLSELGQNFAQALRRLFFWSSSNIWSQPHKDEVVNFELLLRMLISFTGKGEGMIDVSIRRDDGWIRLCFSRSLNAEVRVFATGQSNAPAHVILNASEFKKALTLKENEKWSGYLRIEGDRNIAVRLLPILENYDGKNYKTHKQSIDGENTVGSFL